MSQVPEPRVSASFTVEFDPREMSRRGRIGAHRLHALHDSREITAKARECFLTRFEREVDPDEALPPEERRRRAEHAKRAYFSRLALKSAESRRKPKSSLVPEA